MDAESNDLSMLMLDKDKEMRNLIDFIIGLYAESI